MFIRVSVMFVLVWIMLVWGMLMWVRVFDLDGPSAARLLLRCEYTSACGTDKAGFRLETGPAEMRMPRRQVTTIK